MSTQQRSPEPALKTSLQAAYAAASAEQPSSLPTQEEQDKYLEGRPRATPHHLGIALQHAHQIQAQKDAEEMILDRIIELLALPSSPSADPATPSPQDAQLFKSALYPFRPSDYDSLVTERNNEDLCGYGLCPRKNRKDSYTGGQQSFRFKYGTRGSGPGGRGRSMDIVPSDNIEKWCSDQCAERALFIRVQLGEKPVWERRANDTQAKNIQLLEEGRAKLRTPKAESSKAAMRTSHLNDADVTAGMRNLDIQDSERSQELALERGDTSHVLRHGRVGVHIQEKEHGSLSSASAPRPRPEDATGGSIEGYVPQERLGKDSSSQNEGDLLDQI